MPSALNSSRPDFLSAQSLLISALWLMEYRRAQVSSQQSVAQTTGVTGQSESNAQRNKAAATRAVKGYVGGFLMAMAVEFVISIMMLSIFAWQAFL